jgi:hypothetical protein
MSSKRTIYERNRRHKLREERKIALVLKPWLEVACKDVYAEFFSYFNHLEKNNPAAFNLTKTNEFRAFIAGMFVSTPFIYFLRLYVHFVYFRPQRTRTGGQAS